MVDVHIVGAGPGDPELITRKGYRLVQEADVVIYAGSLVNPAILEACKPGCEIHNSATMNLDEVLAVMKASVEAGKSVVRLHTGDPRYLRCDQEQMDALAGMGISYEVVPGVSSFLATAAALKQEYTLPNVSQTVIITRMEGRTPMPPKEKLRMLASHEATMCIFLSVQMLDKVVAELIEGGYDKNDSSGNRGKSVLARPTHYPRHIGNHCGHRSERRRIAPSYDRSKPCIR